MPFLAPGSGFVNFAGGYALGPEGGNVSHVRSIMERNAGHLRVLVNGERIFPDATRQEPRQSDIDDALRTYGLRIDMADCETITINGMKPKVRRALQSSIPLPPRPPPKLRYVSYLATCGVLHGDPESDAETTARRKANLTLDRVEDACPTLFKAPRPQTQHENNVWYRVYPQTDLTAWIEDGDIKFIDPGHGDGAVFVGREEDWLKSPQELDCGRRHQIYFAELTRPHE